MKCHQAIQDYQQVFGTESGKAVLHDLMKRGGCLSTSMHADSHMTAYNEGRRSLVLEILSRLRMTEQQLNELSRKEEE